MSSEITSEKVAFQAHPEMFRQSPFAFLFCIALIPVLGIGLLLLAIWWLATKAEELIVTNKRTIIRRGLLSKTTNEVLHRDIRHLQVKQSLLQRLFRVGDIGVSSAAQSGIEIVFLGLANPYEVKAIIDRHRFV